MDEKEIDDVVRSCARLAVPLLRSGWIQGSLWNESRTQFCMLGAFIHAAYPLELNTLDENRAVSELGRRINMVTRRIYSTAPISLYNDDPCRILDDVVDTMSRIADGEGMEPAEEKTE